MFWPTTTTWTPWDNSWQPRSWHLLRPVSGPCEKTWSWLFLKMICFWALGMEAKVMYLSQRDWNYKLDWNHGFWNNSCGIFNLSQFCLVFLLLLLLVSGVVVVVVVVGGGGGGGGGGVFDNCHCWQCWPCCRCWCLYSCGSFPLCQDGRLERVLSRTSDMDVLRQRVSAQMLAAAEDGRLDVAMQKKDQVPLNHQTSRFFLKLNLDSNVSLLF